jgi:NADH-quinone oxidoreductase subunit J
VLCALLRGAGVRATGVSAARMLPSSLQGCIHGVPRRLDAGPDPHEGLPDLPRPGRGLRMTIALYVAAAIALIATFMVITRRSAMHAVLYLIVSLLAVAVVFFVLGAPFAAAMEIIIYAGAIMVLFLFVLMMLNLSDQEQRSRVSLSAWIGPSLLVVVLLVELLAVFVTATPGATGARPVGPKEVGIVLFGPYLLAVELASMLLLAGLVGAWHLGRPEDRHSRGESS